MSGEFMRLHGRRKILTATEEITRENILTVLADVLPVHQLNAGEIDYLWHYYRGKQPIEDRTKDVRPEIMNVLVVNRAFEIVSFKTGYLMGEPVQYTARGSDTETVADELNDLNEYMFAEEKASRDKELADWFHICGTAFRMGLPDDGEIEEDEAPFEIYTLDPRRTFVAYHDSPGNKPVLGVTYTKTEDGRIRYSCYTRDTYFEILDAQHIVKVEDHLLGEVPIIEYPLNIARIGAFELVITLLDAINTVGSNRIDGVEQFVQALMLFHNTDISSEDFRRLREEGAIKYKDIDPQMKAEIEYLISNLDQSQTQTLVDDLYQDILTICGMPNRNGGSSTSDTGTAVIFRDGWSAAETRAKDAELMFKQSEKRFLKVVLNICRVTKGLNIGLRNIEIRFTRRNYEAITEKANVLVTLLNNDKIHPRLAFEHSGLFVDPDLAYSLSQEYHEEQVKEAQEPFRNREEDPTNDFDNDNDQTGRRAGDREDPEIGESGRG